MTSASLVLASSPASGDVRRPRHRRPLSSHPIPTPERGGLAQASNCFVLHRFALGGSARRRPVVRRDGHGRPQANRTRWLPDIPAPWRCSQNSSTRRLSPIPASPPIRTAVIPAAAVELRAVLSWASSSARPTNLGDDSRGPHLTMFASPAATRRSSAATCRSSAATCRSSAESDEDGPSHCLCRLFSYGGVPGARDRRERQA